MRTILLALFCLSVPRLAAGQLAPRSIAIELGMAGETGAALPSAVPVALLASWAVDERLDVVLRAAWRAGQRTSGRETDALVEAGPGLRLALAGGALRPELVADLAVIQRLPGLFEATATGIRLGGGAGVELFFAADLSLAAVGEATVTAMSLAQGARSGAGLLGTLRLAAYF